MKPDSDHEGYLEMRLALFGTEVFSFRLAVDDFKTKWALIALGSSVVFFALAIEAKGVFIQ